MNTNVIALNLFSKDIGMDMVACKQSIFDQNQVHRIDQDGLIHQVPSMVSMVEEMAKDQRTTIKFEGMEKWSPKVWDFCNSITHSFGAKAVTAHMFVAAADGYTFGDHVDLDDVYMYVLKGRKHVVITKPVVTILNGESVTEFVETEHVIEAGFYLFVPAGTKHRAVNKEHSEMLSISAEKWIKDKP